VTPAPIAEEGYLDTLDLKNETFTVVGYGTDESSPVAPHRRRRSPSCTAGVCFGDSGGPLFHGETIVALTRGRLATAAPGRTWSIGSIRRSLRSS
jgi:hypothetical protein